MILQDGGGGDFLLESLIHTLIFHCMGGGGGLYARVAMRDMSNYRDKKPREPNKMAQADTPDT